VTGALLLAEGQFDGGGRAALCQLLHNTQIGYGGTRHGLRIMPPTHSQQFVDFKEGF
jgi:hypothetical protein